jgi:hypothetical protein
MGDIRDRVMDRLDEKHRPASSEAKACEPYFACDTVFDYTPTPSPCDPSDPRHTPPTPADGLRHEMKLSLRAQGMQVDSIYQCSICKTLLYEEFPERDCPAKIYAAERVSAATAETQKKLDSARVVIEHYADTATWSPCESNDVQHRHYEADFIDSPDGMSNGWECARKWLDAEQGGGE